MNIDCCKTCTILVAASCFMLLVACATPFERTLKTTREDPALIGSQSALVVKSLSDGAFIIQSHADRFFIPASNMKLFTTAAALVLLGPEFRYATNLYVDGEPIDGVMYGNLVIRGVGDPTLSGRFHARGADEIFTQWAETLLNMGVREVRGNIVGDGSLFGGDYLGAGWAWDDEVYCYSAEISALSVNDNCVAVSIRPGTNAGEPALVSVDDLTGLLLLRTQAVTAAQGEEPSLHVSREPGSNILTVAGSIAADAAGMEFFVSIHRPALFAAAHLQRALESKGIRVSGTATDQQSLRESFSYESTKLVASYTSPPLREIITHINKSSSNLYAELLFRTLGERFRGNGSAKTAVEALREILTNMSVPADSIVVYDGSGLSRMNLVTPSALTALLEYMYRHEHFSYFLASLPVSGVDGTLSKRMRHTPAGGRIFAKTGSMTHVQNLSGYLKGGQGEMYLFSFLVNNFSGSAESVRQLQDALLARLVDLAK
ncbi:MAG TPA: D-alanyl-D-alanine carboxypeptidase/D-alanyl-D-alanine-endopeptidase [Syntrophorhabdales bacterium]|nr:D-alanyl-D-alanine carboxypeptidase/D-alanyl-D-alanine-endopeptidase [Syntrophorhabdales bacterium]